MFSRFDQLRYVGLLGNMLQKVKDGLLLDLQLSTE